MSSRLATTITLPEGPGIRIKFPFDLGMIEKVKSLEDRRYIVDGKYWTCPLTVPVVRQLRDWGFELAPDLAALLAPRIPQRPDEDHSFEVPGLRGELFPFQQSGVAFIDAHHGRAIIGDEMGLGKTIQALAWLQLRQDLRPAVIVVPASLKLLWAEKAREWLPNPQVQVLYGLSSAEQSVTGQIVIVNYELMWSRLEQLKQLQPKVLVIDEIHNIMHQTAKQTRATISLGKHCRHVIGLGGTPIINRPMEAYNALRLIDPTLLPLTRFQFGIRYCAGYHNGFGWVFKGSSRTAELHEKLTRVMIRRLKTDVLPQLPPKIRTVVPMEITNRAEYEAAEQDFLAWIRKTKGNEAARRASFAEAFTKAETLKQVAVKGKLDALDSWISEFLASGAKLVLFATHHATVEHVISKHQKEAIRLIGGMSAEESAAAVKRFQQDASIKLLVGILDSRGRPAGVGHTLTAAAATAFAELPWSPAICDQAEDRVHRIGQTADSVAAYYLVATGTIETEITALLDAKRKVVDAVLDGKDTAEDSLLAKLLNEYETKAGSQL